MRIIIYYKYTKDAKGTKERKKVKEVEREKATERERERAERGEGAHFITYLVVIDIKISRRFNTKNTSSPLVL